jgi:hypothetical protein
MMMEWAEERRELRGRIEVLLHCCYTVVTLLLHCRDTVVTLL